MPGQLVHAAVAEVVMVMVGEPQADHSTAERASERGVRRVLERPAVHHSRAPPPPTLATLQTLRGKRTRRRRRKSGERAHALRS